jgi:enamine deaminase RidA (YjgF/YER057c/UK114 family)
MDPVRKEAIEPDPARRLPGMSQAVRVGDTIYLSGQVAFGSDGGVVGLGDARAQAAQCFANIASALETAGGLLSDVVKLTCFLVDGDDFGAYAEVKKALFSEGVAPASTTIIIKGLLIAGLLMEIEAVAVVTD